MELLAEAARLAEATTLDRLVSHDNNTDSMHLDINPPVTHTEEETKLDNSVVEASEEEQIAYLRELLEHQVEVCVRLEEECALLSSFLLRSQFKNLTETAFFSAFRRKNVPPDELGKFIEPPKLVNETGKRTSPDSSSGAGAAAAKKPRVGDNSRGLKDGADSRSKGKAKDHKDEGPATSSTRPASPVKTTMTAQQIAHQKIIAAAEKARIVAMRKASAEKRAAEVKRKALEAAALMKPPPDTAGEEARLLGEKILQRLATSGSVVATKAMLTEDDEEVRRKAEAARQQQSQASSSQQAQDCHTSHGQQQAVPQGQSSASEGRIEE
mmetsp:Transcript_29292/g.54302  ORF Transcript_29292/g.54302 Transcript_29292/m.54302 type:complete len:326 (+) Transcript_29292:97-1074(+)